MAAGTLTGGASLAKDTEVKIENGRFSAETVLGERSMDGVDQASSIAVGSNLAVGGNLRIGAAGDINIQGSGIAGSGDMLFAAERDINITEAQNTYSKDKSHEETTVKATAGAGNAYVDVAFVLLAILEAGEIVEKAKSALESIEKLREEGRATPSAVRDAKASLAAAYASLLKAKAALVDAVAAAAGSSATYGFYAKAGLALDTLASNENTAQTSSLASSITAGGDIYFSAGNDMAQIGSHVSSNSGSVIYDVANDLIFGASRNTSKSSSDTSRSTASMSIGTNGSVSGNVGHAESKSASEAASYNYSGTTAENGSIIYRVGGDMDAIGYNALARDIDLEVAGNLTLESLQNTSSSSNSSWGFDVGYSKNGADAKLNGKIELGSGQTDSALVNRQTSIIGTNSVNIYTGKNTHLKGALIAAHNDNLTLDTGTLSFEDMYGGKAGTSMGLKLSGSLGPKPAEKQAQGSGSQNKPAWWNTVMASQKAAKDKWSEVKPYLPDALSYNNSGEEQTVRATVGGGTIIVRGDPGMDLSSLNRDLSRAVTTKELPGLSFDIKDHINFVDNVFGQFDKVDNILDTTYAVLDEMKKFGEAPGKYIGEQWDKADKKIQDGREKIENIPGKIKEGIKNGLNEINKTWIEFNNWLSARQNMENVQ